MMHKRAGNRMIQQSGDLLKQLLKARSFILCMYLTSQTRG